MTLTAKKIEFIKNKVQTLIDKGATKSYAISVVCNDMGINAKGMMNILFPESSKEKTNYEDIKTSEGSVVALKNNPSKEYKVININNKNSISITDMDNNSNIKYVKEEDIIPVVTETEMKKSLKEANYNLSIDGLETTDAETLSQMLTLAGQAESSEDIMPSTEIPSEENIGMGAEESEEFDVIDASEDMGMGEESVIDDTFGFEEFEQFPVSEGKIEEDLLLDPRTKDETFNAEQEMAEKDDEELVETDKSNDNWPLTPEEKKILNSLLGKQYKAYNGNIYEITDCSIGGWSGDVIDIEITNKNTGFSDSFEDMESFRDFIESYDLEPIGNNTGLLPNGLDDLSDDDEDDEELVETDDIEVNIDDSDADINFDEEIAECLRLAGVELNEVSDEKATKGKKDLPNVVGKETAFSCAKKDGFKPGENQRPDYRCVKRENTMGKESSEGFAKPMRIESMVNRGKIEAICETATRMYAKKDHNEWLALDRRYVEKLIKEGCSYSRASKLILKAKKGK